MSIAYGDYNLSKKTNLKDFLNRKKKRFQVFENAACTSIEDIKFQWSKFSNEPSLKQYAKLSRSLFNSSTWLAKSAFRLVRPFEPTYSDKVNFLRSEQSQYILSRVREKKSISYKRATYNEIFKTIFYDFEISHQDSTYKKISHVPKIESSVLLVSGILNEIFTTPAFERGAKYIKDTYDINFDYCPTSGIKDTAENSLMIKKHIEKLLQNNSPVWFFSFSKGGVDTLHFLKEHGQDFREHICGLSTVASPILGSERVNHKVLQLINKIHAFEKSSLYKVLDNHFDVFFKDFQKSLSSEFQESWFQENFSFLPRNMFYTALALESNWYESHIWMVLTKLFFQSQSINDGIVDAERALYPDYFQGINLGILKGHHLIGTRSSDYVQEALIEAHIVFLNYLGLLR
ncbi:MAG: hypothetical protein K9K67_02495 [Bacteriovoracaceae bacterium]|nr:hypothetical protein [Bacteriovoracaceae bacterium]